MYGTKTKTHIWPINIHIALSIYGQYFVIALRTHGRWSVDIVLRNKVVQIIFWHASFAKKQGACVDSEFWLTRG